MNQDDYITIRNGDTVRKVRRSEYFNSGISVLPENHDLDAPEVGPLNNVVGGLSSAPQSHGSHARQDDSAVMVAEAHIRTSIPILLVNAVICAGIIILAFIAGLFSGSYLVAFGGWLVLWGGMSYYALAVNRKQGLEHTPSGVARHEIDRKYDSLDNLVDAHYEYLRERSRNQLRDRGADGNNQLTD